MEQCFFCNQFLENQYDGVEFLAHEKCYQDNIIKREGTRKLTKREVMANDIEGIMQDTFPYYESDDKDDFIYLVKKQDIREAAHRIVRCFEELKAIANLTQGGNSS